MSLHSFMHYLYSTLVHAEGQFNSLAIANFVSVYKLPSVITFRQEDASDIFENPMKQVTSYFILFFCFLFWLIYRRNLEVITLIFIFQLWLFTPERSCKVVSIFKEVANAFKGKVIVNIHTSIYYILINLNSYTFGYEQQRTKVPARILY